MFVNPFTPIFGGKPDFFFGRKEILRRFRAALNDRGSEERALFVTGTRGCGKTALVEQLSQVAGEHGWMTIDLGAENLTQTLLCRLVDFAEKSSTLSPQVSVSVLGSGGSIGAGSTAKTVRYAQEDLQLVFQNACLAHERELLVGMSRTMGEDRVARVADVAAALGRQAKQLSRARESLLDEGIVLSPGRGELMFNIPYLASYVLKPRGEDEEVALARSWRL